MNSLYNSHAEFHENPRDGLVAVTTSQTDRQICYCPPKAFFLYFLWNA